MAKGYNEFDGFDPRNGKRGTYRISIDLISRIAARVPAAKLRAAYCAKAVVANPTVAFRGLRTVDEKFGDPREYVSIPDPFGLCLCGIPPSAVLEKAGLRNHPGYTFAVFVDKELTVTDWDWIAESRFNPAHPIGWEYRFVERIWPN